MLKKLVKYGNSNALVLDKAILELLDIEEGSLVKIKTDGKAIIITAHQTPTAPEKITPVITHTESIREAAGKEMLKQYTHLDQTQKELFAKEWADYQNEMDKTANAIDKKIEDILEEHQDTQSDEYKKSIQTIQNTLGVEINQISQKMTALPEKYDLPNLNQQQMTSMQDDFAEHFKKHADTQTKMMNVINNPNYMHELQLLSEKYTANEYGSAEYIKATRKILYKYIPEMRQADKEMAAITKKYEFTQ
jgi:antitoxin component of MazEF toxin-antitoxin module